MDKTATTRLREMCGQETDVLRRLTMLDVLAELDRLHIEVDQLRGLARGAIFDFEEISDEIEGGTYYDAQAKATRGADHLRSALGGAR